MKNILAGRPKGFTLLELAIALAGLALMTTAAVPYFIRQAEIAAANNTTREVSAIEEASKWYYVNNKVWPGSVGTLQSAGFLNPSWSATNPWGNAYSISSTPTRLTVTTTVPNNVAGVLSRALPGVSSWVSGSNRIISSSIPVPGQEASLANKASLPHDPIYIPSEWRNRVQYQCPDGYVVVGTLREESRAQIPRGLICASLK